MGIRYIFKWLMRGGGEGKQIKAYSIGVICICKRSLIALFRN